MTRFDKRGHPISYGSQQAIDALDHACDLLHAYQASMFAFHLWWHKALFHVDMNDAASALKLFDEKRDMFSWTVTEAAIRLGDRALADTFATERLSWKPESPINRPWAMRAESLKPSAP